MRKDPTHRAGAIVNMLIWNAEFTLYLGRGNRFVKQGIISNGNRLTVIVEEPLFYQIIFYQTLSDFYKATPGVMWTIESIITGSIGSKKREKENVTIEFINGKVLRKPRPTHLATCPGYPA